MRIYRGWRLSSVLLIIAAVFGLKGFASAESPEPRLPPLLRNVTAQGGRWGACPPRNESEASLQKILPLAVSPELNQRLLSEFPPGSTEDRLIEELSKQGFTMLPPCKNDQSIHSAVFQQHGAGLFSSFPITANIFWKVDHANAVVCTKGFVAFTGL